MVTKRPVRQHGSTGYQYGCRCLECKAGHAERIHNRQSIGTGSRKGVDNLAEPRAMGDTERAVLAEVETMTSAPNDVDVLAVRKLAKILDNPKLTAMHPRTTAEFVRALYVMHPKPEKRRTKGRLVAVRKITNE